MTPDITMGPPYVTKEVAKVVYAACMVVAEQEFESGLMIQA